jgi:hypothetical protein
VESWSDGILRKWKPAYWKNGILGKSEDKIKTMK